MRLSKNPCLVINGQCIAKKGPETLFCRLSYSRPKGVIYARNTAMVNYSDLTDAEKDLLNGSDYNVVPELISE